MFVKVFLGVFLVCWCVVWVGICCFWCCWGSCCSLLLGADYSPLIYTLNACRGQYMWRLRVPWVRTAEKRRLFNGVPLPSTVAGAALSKNMHRPMLSHWMAHLFCWFLFQRVFERYLRVFPRDFLKLQQPLVMGVENLDFVYEKVGYYQGVWVLLQMDFIFSGDQFSGFPVRRCLDSMTLRNSARKSVCLLGIMMSLFCISFRFILRWAAIKVSRMLADVAGFAFTTMTPSVPCKSRGKFAQSPHQALKSSCRFLQHTPLSQGLPNP